MTFTSTRRQFFKHVSGAMALSALPSPSPAAGRIDPMSLGYSLYGMKMVPLAESFSVCARIGYRSVEVCMFPGFPGDPELISKATRRELRRQLDSLGLAVSSIMPQLQLNGDDKAQLQTLEILKRAAELGHDLGFSGSPLIQAQVLDGRPPQWDELKGRMVARLGEWADTLSTVDAIAALGAHVGRVVNTPDRLLRLYHQVDRPELSLYYNHIHYALEGFPLEQSLPVLIPFSKFLHLQDATGTAAKKNYLLPGDPDGPTDFSHYFRLLAENSYQGPLVVHISGRFSRVTDYDPISVARICYQRMAKALQRAGQAGY